MVTLENVEVYIRRARFDYLEPPTWLTEIEEHLRSWATGRELLPGESRFNSRAFVGGKPSVDTAVGQYPLPGEAVLKRSSLVGGKLTVDIMVGGAGGGAGSQGSFTAASVEETPALVLRVKFTRRQDGHVIWSVSFDKSERMELAEKISKNAQKPYVIVDRNDVVHVLPNGLDGWDVELVFVP